MHDLKLMKYIELRNTHIWKEQGVTQPFAVVRATEDDIAALARAGVAFRTVPIEEAVEKYHYPPEILETQITQDDVNINQHNALPITSLMKEDNGTQSDRS